MVITISLDHEFRRRDIKMSAGDERSISIVAYANEDDTAPVTVTLPTLAVLPWQAFTMPVDGSTFTVPDEWPGRWSYRITGEIAGDRRTLCWGTIEIFGGERFSYPRGNDYGWGWPEPYPWR